MSQTTSALADHYLALGREEKAAAIRTWLHAVKKELEKELAVLPPSPDGFRTVEQAELEGGISIITVLLARMNEASDTAPAAAPQA